MLFISVTCIFEPATLSHSSLPGLYPATLLRKIKIVSFQDALYQDWFDYVFNKKYILESTNRVLMTLEGKFGSKLTPIFIS